MRAPRASCWMPLQVSSGVRQRTNFIKREMDIQQVPDWRLFVAAEIGDVTPNNALRAQPGNLVVLLTTTTLRDEGQLAFPKVSPYRLALSIAIKSSQEAATLRKGLNFTPRKGSKMRDLDLKSLPSLYDYFEQCMIAATFSYQALETYSNQVIEDKLPDGKTFVVTRNGEQRALDAASLQRDASTEEKVATIMPDLVGKPLSKQSKLWQQFTILRRVRDSIIHLKTIDHRSAAELDRETVFYRLLNNTPAMYAKTAVEVMRHFVGPGELSWLAHAEQRITGK